jgi:ADP-ribosylation factor protein 6
MRILRLEEVAHNHMWKVQPSCAKTGDGIFEGLVSGRLSITSH